MTLVYDDAVSHPFPRVRGGERTGIEDLQMYKWALGIERNSQGVLSLSRLRRIIVYRPRRPVFAPHDVRLSTIQA